MNKGRQLLSNLPILLVFILTMVVLIYVGFGEAKRTYPNFQFKKMATQAEIIKHAFDPYLQAGLPLNQFSGFPSLGEGLLQSDSVLEKIQVFDPEKKIIFFKTRNVEEQITNTYSPFLINLDREECLTEESLTSFRVIMPLVGKFGFAGQIVVEASKEKIFKTLNDEYKIVFNWFAIITALFSGFILFYEFFIKNKQRQRTVITTAYFISFIAMTVLIAVVVFKVYEHGAKSNTKALSDSMAQRLSAIIELGLNVDDIDGINDAFNDYKESNPDINAIALTANGVSKYHTNLDNIGKPYVPARNSYEYVVELINFDKPTQEFRVAVTIPIKVVMRAIRSSAKSFIVLFIACGLVALIFLDGGVALLTSNEIITKRQDETLTGFASPNSTSEAYKVSLSLIKPAYFLIVFVNAMAVPFLPQLVSKMAAETGSSIASASLPFTIYYAIFAIVLIPAGIYAEKGSLRKLMGLGFISEVIGLMIVALTNDYWFLSLGRAFSGLGQGVFLIGLQSYLLVVTPEEKRTQGAAVKVIGRNSGLIAGAAIGALLYAFMDYKQLFMISSSLSLIGFIYLLALVPGVESFVPTVTSALKEKIKPRNSQMNRRSKIRIFRNIIEVLKDKEVVKTLSFIGIIAKMSITGVVMFAIPLLLSKQGVATEDIGLALMLFYVSSMIMTRYASRLVDSQGTTRFVLFASSIIGGISMVVLGFIGTTIPLEQSFLPGGIQLTQAAIVFNELVIQLGIQNSSFYIVLFCLILAGISNGLMAAPVFTHISKTEVSKRFGTKSVAATYIFLERIGHVLGPMLISMLFILTFQSNIALSFFGSITIVLGGIFIVTSKKM